MDGRRNSSREGTNERHTSSFQVWLSRIINLPENIVVQFVNTASVVLGAGGV
ncbi:hypothetical protein [Leptolyngbya sp. FACHB-16]|uniref:hypothetical protein n=1 Tax=Leptolyngbya sp. NM2-A1 TaxID=2933909 RepID=UPI001687B670